MQALGATLLVLLAAGCRSQPALPAAPPPADPAPAASAPPSVAPPPHAEPQAPPAPSAQDLPGGWASVPLEGFGTLLEQQFPAGEPRTLVPSAFEELASALRGDDALALRALELLARCRDPLAGEILLQRLERRTKPAPEADLGAAIDLTAAAALANFPDARNVGARLEALATSRKPHPDLEVRVECACSALHLGREKLIPFLLQVLKQGTHLASASAAWTPIVDMSFCQGRAAAALSERAERPSRYRPLQSLDERETDIRALEAQLARKKP